MTFRKKPNKNDKQTSGDNVISIASVLKTLRQENEQLKSRIDQDSQENAKLHILCAQQQKDMEGIQKKYEKIEAEKEKLSEENRILLSALNTLKEENQQLKRMVFGQSTEKTKAAGHESTNTTELPEGTAGGSSDTDTTEEKMAGDSAETSTSAGKISSGKDIAPRGKKNGTGEKTSRATNIRRQMEAHLPTVHYYPLSEELVKKLDDLYGKGQWRLMNWEGTAHLVHIPEMYVNQIDYVPIICMKDGTPRRPFTEYPEEFPTSILPHSILSPSEFANLIHKKFAMGIPLYRQEQDMLQMSGIHLGRQDMAGWIIRAGTQGFLQMYEYLIRQERACEYHSIDETYLQVILDGRAASTSSYLWAHRTGELASTEHPIVVFVYEPTRATEHLRKYFPEDIAAVISCDHYIAYETLESERENIHIALCWMHVRRRFFYAFDLVANIPDLSEEVVRESLEARLLKKIGEIYREEMKLKNLTPAERKTERDKEVRPLVKDFFDSLHSLNPDDPSMTKTLQDAVKYALAGEEKLKRFLEDPSIPIDNGSAERIIRKVASGRRAWLFCDTPDGAKALALFYSLVITAQLNGANDYYYIKYLCEHVPGGLLGPIRQLTDEELEVLMPWSKEYKDYEKHQIEIRYDAITMENDMERPTKEDILEIRRQMEKQEVSEADVMDNSNHSPAAQDSSSDMINTAHSENAINKVNIERITSTPVSHNQNELVEVFSPSDNLHLREAEQKQENSAVDLHEESPPDFQCPEVQRSTG